MTVGASAPHPNRRQQKRRSDGIAAQTLLRYAHSVMTAAGVERSPSWVSRAVRDYVRHGLGRQRFGDYLTDRLNLTAHQRDRAELAGLLAYADPTGETAVRNVMQKTNARPSQLAGSRTGHPTKKE